LEWVDSWLATAGPLGERSLPFYVVPVGRDASPQAFGWGDVW